MLQPDPPRYFRCSPDSSSERGVDYSNLPHPTHLATNRPAPLPNRSALTMVGILTGSITRVRTSDSRYRLRSLSISNQLGVAGIAHPFTREMITTLTCGYCNSRLNSIDDLRYHLGNVRYHPVFSCCGRFFKREADFVKHREAKSNHNHEVTRNT